MLDLTNTSNIGDLVDAIISQAQEAGLLQDRTRIVSLTIIIEGEEEEKVEVKLA